MDIFRETEIAFDSGFNAGVDYARNFMKDEFKNLNPNEFPKIKKDSN